MGLAWVVKSDSGNKYYEYGDFRDALLDFLERSKKEDSVVLGNA